MALFIIAFSIAMLCCLVTICALVFIAIFRTESTEDMLACFAGISIILLLVLALVSMAIDFIPQLLI